MGLHHEFFLITKNELQKMNNITLSILTNKVEKVEISDEIMEYIKDTLEWIPAYSVDAFEKINGLDYFYCTVIHKNGATTLKNVLEGWISLFKNSPQCLRLRGELVMEEGEESWSHRVIDINRDELICEFSKLVAFSVKVINSEEYCIFHMGI